MLKYQRPDARTEPTRNNSPRLVFFAAAAAVFLLFALAAPLFAQVPRAIVTGPKESRCGSLIVLDASESVGTSRLWLLAVSPEETSFLPVESGLKCIFASPVSGVYRFVLVVAGTNANGGAVADMTTHTVTLSGGTVTPPPITPPPPTDPTTPPSATTGVAYLVIVRRNEELTADQAAELLKLRQWSDQQPEKVSQLEVTPEAGGDDERLAGYVAKAGPLPWVVLSRSRKDGKGAAVLWSGALGTAEEVKAKVAEAVK
jgi:hypothetical protein